MKIIEDRRALHQIPELDKQLPKTMEYLRNALCGLNCTVFSPIPSSLCAWFDFGAEDAIAFRTDADALPIREKNKVDYVSQHPGWMHACGHDGHMAIALELARRLSEKKTMKHNVLIVFQPAEETTGGAQDICETGVMTQYNVKAIFALHLWPGQKEGTMASRRMEMMSRSCEVMVDIYGKSSHIAKPKEGVDALAAGVAFYQKARDLERSLPDSVFRLLNFGKFESGTVGNAISAHTHLHGSLRSFQDDVFDFLSGGLQQAAKNVEAETGCRVELDVSYGYPAVMNPGELYDYVRSIMTFDELAEPVMITEDFSWYQRYVPGVFFFLGTGDTPALHADNFNFNEAILQKGADFFEELAVKF